MKQQYHTIIKPDCHGRFVGWVEEIAGTITTGRSLDECRHNLKDALSLMLETRRDEARMAMDPSCLQELVEVETMDDNAIHSSDRWA
jgi:predicted RNase H-like HicB family nuclease